MDKSLTACPQNCPNRHPACQDECPVQSRARKRREAIREARLKQYGEIKNYKRQRYFKYDDEM